MSIYKGEVRAQGSYGLPAPTGAFTGFLQGQAGYAFQCRDTTFAPPIVYTISVFVAENSFGAGPTLEYQTWVGLGIDDSGGPINQAPPPANIYYNNFMSAPDGTNGSQFGPDWTLSITKDNITGDVTFVHPLGSTTVNLFTLGVPAGRIATSMEPHAIGLTFRDAQQTADNFVQVLWSAFWGSVDGTRDLGAAMSDIQPGVWLPWSVVVGMAPAPGLTESQEMNWEATLLSDPSGPVYNSWQADAVREWNGGHFIPIMGEIDMTQAREHGLVFRVYAVTNAPETLFFGRSGDNGLTWRTVTVHSGDIIPGIPSFPRSLNIAWYARQLVVVWEDGDDIYQTTSSDLGEHWEAPVLLSANLPGVFVACAPRMIIHQDHGLLFYAYVDRLTGNVYLRRSGLAVLTGFLDNTGTLIGALALVVPPDLFVDTHHNVRLVYILTLTQTLTKSVDLASNWEDDPAWVPPVANRLTKSLYDPKLGLSYHVFYKTTDGSVQAYASANDGFTPTPTATPRQVEIVGLDQRPALALLPGEGVILGYFDAIGAVVHKFSVDFAMTFA